MGLKINVENFKLNGLSKYKLDYNCVKKENPGIIYCSITGFGQDGPYAKKLGYDFIIQAMGEWGMKKAQPIKHPLRKHFINREFSAIEKVLEKSGWRKNDVDLYEVNEAFAVVPMAVMKDLGVSDDILNIYGGACALGHPVGASGARIVTTLINALKKNNLKRGVASLCIGGGEATALALEIVN